MEIKAKITRRSGQIHDAVYNDVANWSDLDGRKIKAVHAYCFYGDKMVIVYAANKNVWTPPGGGVEEGENVVDALFRELKEEANMKVMEHQLIGVIDINEPTGVVTHVRAFCTVEPFGEFVSDPDGDITEIKLIDPSEYNNYCIDWEIIGDHVVLRSLDIKKRF